MRDKNIRPCLRALYLAGYLLFLDSLPRVYPVVTANAPTTILTSIAVTGLITKITFGSSSIIFPFISGSL